MTKQTSQFEETSESAFPEEAEVPVIPPVDPETIGADAVKTTSDGRKVGWQQPPIPYVPPALNTCKHMGAAMARINLSRRAIGHEWVCLCGQTFVVKIGGGGNKILAKKEEEAVPDEPEA